MTSGGKVFTAHSQLGPAAALPGWLAEEVKKALEGDSCDAERDALVSVAQHFGVAFDPEAQEW